MRSLLLAVAIISAAQAVDIPLSDPLKNPGFQHFYNNEYDEAIAAFQKQASQHPNDPEPFNHLAQAILYREMFRTGALESQLVSGSNPFLRRAKMQPSAEDKQRFNRAISRAIGMAKQMLSTDPNSVRGLYSLGVAHGLRANYLFLVEKAWMDALREATVARKAHNRITELEPSFVDARLIQGVHDYVVGSLPFYMKLLGFLTGFHGDREAGIQTLQMVAKEGRINRYDAEILLAAIYRRERRPQEAISLLKDLSARFPRNYLLRFEQVQMYGDLGNKAAALQVISDIEELRQKSAPGYRNLVEGKVRYLKGNLLFWYGDLELALGDMKLAAADSEELDLNTAVMAWLRLGQIYDLQGKHDLAKEAYHQTVKTAPESAAASEAKRYIANPYRRKIESS